MDSVNTRLAGWFIPFVLSCLVGCQSDKKTNPPADTSPPAAVFDLAAETIDGASVRLTWTSPGDDGWVGMAATYEIRYAAATINDSTWASATEVEGEPTPTSPGAEASFDVTGLRTATIYYFGQKSGDEASNLSACSNSPRAATLGDDRTPPDPVFNLVADSPTLDSITLTWTAPGDDRSDGKAFEYDIRISSEPIDDASFADAVALSRTPLPDSSGRSEQFIAAGLQEDTLYYFALKTLDELLNVSAISNQAFSRTLLSDETPPAAVRDLTADFPLARSIALYWTAPGDDDSSGTASIYDIRYAEEPINTGNWDEATQIENEPEPEEAGVEQGYRVEELVPNREYFFAIKTTDDWMNWSALSNVASGRTLDIYPPEPITDFELENPEGCLVGLNWTAPTDDSTEAVTAYDLRYATFPIDEQSWGRAEPSLVVPPPAEPGIVERVALFGFARGEVFHFALRSIDEADNLSPLSNPLSLEMPPAIGSDANWSYGISGAYGWREVRDLTTYDGDLVAAGIVRRIGGSTREGVARWSGSAWQEIGPEIPGAEALIVHEGELYVGGSFREIAGLPILGIARWDAEARQWQALEEGVDGEVYTLASHEGELYLAGLFSQAGNLRDVRNIARWDGERWKRVGSGLGITDPIGPPHVRALTVWNDRIIAGGRFSEYGNVASWMGSSWRPVGGGVTGDVAALTVLDGDLIVGGGGVDAPPLLARWDGSQWWTLGIGIDGNVFALEVYNDRLIVTGWHTKAGGAPAIGIATWDQSCWSPMGSGISGGGNIWTLHVHRERLYVAGDIRVAGGQQAIGIAAWED